ncbi:MAG: hypothetical protein WCK34_08475 [Bacteroidota bacterium]
MTRISFIILLVFSAIASLGQADGILPGDPGFRQKYADFDFKGKFAVVIEKDVANNYYLLDFSKLPARFDRVYFMNLSFGNYKIINVDPVVTENKVCFMAARQYDEIEIATIFEELKTKTSGLAATWTEEEKKMWLTKNDKYK